MDQFIWAGRIIEGEELDKAINELYPEFKEQVEREKFELVEFHTDYSISSPKLRYMRADMQRIARLGMSIGTAQSRRETVTYSWEDKGAWETVKN